MASEAGANIYGSLEKGERELQSEGIMMVSGRRFMEEICRHSHWELLVEMEVVM